MPTLNLQTAFKARLDALFTAVEQDGAVYAEQNHLCCSTCANADLYSRWLAESKPVNRAGAVFYHAQDAETLASGMVHIRYGYFDDTDPTRARDKALGEIICELAHRVQLIPVWDGNPSTAVLVAMDTPENRMLAGKGYQPPAQPAKPSNPFEALVADAKAVLAGKDGNVDPHLLALLVGELTAS